MAKQRGEAKKSPGRPVGSTGPRPEAVAVVNWKPRHDQIVMLHLAGYDNVEIASTLGISAQNVSDILGDPRARALIQQGRNSIVNGLLTQIDAKMVTLAHKSISNLERTINTRIPVAHPMKRHQDKVGLDLLKMIGYGADDKSKDPNKAPVSNDTMERLTRALERSERVREIEVGSIQEAEIEILNEATG